MSVSATAIFIYFLANIVLAAFITRRTEKRDQVGFFLANRRVAPILFFLSMAATNFSAFTIFGFSGAGYRLGYAFYPLMAFGTGFMALSFVIIGIPLHRLASQRNYITPADFILDRYRSEIFKKAFSLLLVVFTLPYLALQGMFAGKILHLFAAIPYELGSLLVLAVVMLYVSSGGMHSVAWTDALQGLLIVFSMLLAFFIIAKAAGGFLTAHKEILEIAREHLERGGAGGAVSFSFHFSYILLWFFSVPMFPQIFQRFYSARDDEAIKRAMCFYPLATTFLFFLTVAIGVMALTILPNLETAKSDEVLILLMNTLSQPFLIAFVALGALAALMSTLSSQVLSLSSLIVQDFFPPRSRSLSNNRLVIVVISLIAYFIALNPPLTILGFLSKMSFQGFAACAPTVFLGLFWRKTTTLGAAGGLAAGVGATLLGILGLLPSGVPEIYVILSVGFGVTIMVSLFGGGGSLPQPLVKLGAAISPFWAVVFGALLLFGCDFWNWGGEVSPLWGLPLFMWHFFALGLALFAGFAIFARQTR